MVPIWSKFMMSEVEERPTLVTAGYGVYYWTVQYVAKTIWAQVIAMACGI